jgi:hypothetical protein
MRTAWQRAELLFCLFVVGVLALALWTSLGWSQRAGLFPWVVLIPTLALALWQLVDDLRGKTAPPATAVGEAGEAAPLAQELPAGEMARRGAGVAGWILGFFAAIWLLGFPLGGGLASAAYLRFAARERWPVCLGYGLGAYVVLELFFRQLLAIPFADGALFEWLGLELPFGG